MKKSVLVLLALGISLMATDELPFVCEQSDISWAGDNRYFRVGDSEGTPLILADSKTIQIDRKNKIIKVWTVGLASNERRKEMINRHGYQYGKYGYSKSLDILDYNNMRYKFANSTEYKCTGYPISSASWDTWEPIPPGSVMEEITENIMKKYNLK